MKYTNILPDLSDNNWTHFGATNVVKNGHDFSATFGGLWEGLVYTISDGSLRGKRIRFGFNSLAGDNIEVYLQDQNWDMVGGSISASNTPKYIDVDIPDTASVVKFTVGVQRNNGSLDCAITGMYMYDLDEVIEDDNNDNVIIGASKVLSMYVGDIKVNKIL